MINATNFKSGSVKQKSFAQDILNSTHEAAICDLRNYEILREREGDLPKVVRAIDNNKAVIESVEAMMGKKFSAKSVIEAATPRNAMYYQDKCWKIDFDAIK